MFDLITTHFQSSLLGYFKTGNPLVDTLTTTILISCLSWIITDRSRLWTSVQRFFEFQRGGTKPKIVISSRKEKASFWAVQKTTSYFEKMSWYLSKYHPPTQGNVELGNCGGTKQLKPESGNIQTLSHEGNTFRFNWRLIKGVVNNNNAVNTEASEDYETITIDGDFETNAPILDFVHHVECAHERFVNHKPWTQKVFVIADTADKAKPEDIWQGQVSGNEKGFASIVLPENEKEALVADLETFFASEEYYKSRGIAWSRGYLSEPEQHNRRQDVEECFPSLAAKVCVGD